MVICYFWLRDVKDSDNWLLVFIDSARRGFLALESNRKTILGPKEKKSWTTLAFPYGWSVYRDLKRNCESDNTWA
jgi:hypothetical protein